MEFSSQSRNELPFLTQGNLPDPGIKLVSLMRSALHRFYHCVTWEAPYVIYIYIYVNEILSISKHVMNQRQVVSIYMLFYICSCFLIPGSQNTECSLKKLY